MTDRATGSGRSGVLSGSGWRLTTPIVVPVGPLATGGSLTVADLAGCGVRALGVDWLRLFLRPGVGVVAALGGAGGLVGWPGPLIAGSSRWALAGASAARVRPDRATVVSPIDGSTHRLSPEEVVDIQTALGLGFVTTLDWPDEAARGDRLEIRRLRLTWAERSLAARPPNASMLVGVPLDSPRDAVGEIGHLPADGFVLEGLGASTDAAAVIRALAELPDSALRVVDWSGGEAGLTGVIAAGVDVVRLVGEAERARAGVALTGEGEVSVDSPDWRDDGEPIEVGCRCFACSQLSRAYVHHLFEAGELLGPRLVEAHNLTRLVALGSGQASPRRMPSVGPSLGGGGRIPRPDRSPGQSV